MDRSELLNEETVKELRAANYLTIIKELYSLGEMTKENYVAELKRALQFESRNIEA